MLKVRIFWDIMLYDPFKVADILEENVASNFRVEHAKLKTRINQATCFMLVSLLGLFFDSEDGGNMCLRNVG
jgi:hypothetical protein